MKVQLPIQNFPAQQTIYDNPARFVIAAKGRRFGATRGAANNFISMAIKRRFHRGLWVDTVNANIERYVERYFIPALKYLKDPQTDQPLWTWRKQQKILTICDSYIDFRSADTPENIEGFDYDYAFLNEAGIILQNEYLWENAIRPMLWDTDCRAVIAGTPKGQNTFHQLYEFGQDPSKKDYVSYKFSSFDNPYAPRDLIMDDIQNMPQRVVSQEIYAEFLDDTGVVFRDVDKVAILDPEKKPQPDPGHMYVMGADIAKLVDYTVLTVFDRTDNHQVEQWRFNGLEYPAIRSRIKHLSIKWNRALVMLDSTGVGEPTYDDLGREGVPVEPIHLTNELKKQMIEKLSNWIELRRFSMLKLDETIRELKRFTYDISEKTGRVFYGAPTGFHDDIVVSLALAVWSMNPVIQRQPTHELSIIEQDILFKTGAATQDDFEEVEDWQLYGDTS